MFVCVHKWIIVRVHVFCDYAYPLLRIVYVAVPCRNQRLFRCIFQAHCCAWSTVLLNLHYGRGSYVQCRCMNILWIYKVRMSPALNRSSVIWHFEGSDAIEIHDGITFDFYTGTATYVDALVCACFMNWIHLRSYWFKPTVDQEIFMVKIIHIAKYILQYTASRVHKNGWLEEECVTP